MSLSRTPWLLAGLLVTPVLAMADEQPKKDGTVLQSVVVTAEKTDEPLKVATDAKAPRQPVPAHDGADYLKTVPGFNVIRKGGTDGDPVFRGMAGSRLNILLDGEMLLGGCGGRMDPPTAYVFPESYDTITVLKGPQTVLYGPGNSAGTVLFERDNHRRDESGANVNASALLGGFNRRDEMFDVTGGTADFYVRGTMTNAQQGDYRDGDGEKVHSQYHRYSSNGAVGWTPNDDTLLELTLAESDGEAAYADRSVDGALFERENAGIKYRQKNLSDVLLQLEAQVYYNYIDHVMDNYSLRLPTGMMAMPMAMNPDRKTVGARFSTLLAVAETTQLTVGVDTQQNEHSNRMTMNQTAMPYEGMKRVDDAEFEQMGLFAEVKHFFSDEQRLISGLRYDNWQGKDERAVVNLNMMPPAVNPTAGETRRDHLGSGFIRYEQDLAIGTVYSGIGRSERFPDYWEIIARESAATVSAFNIDTEKTRQLDIGYLFSEGQWHAGVSAFYNTMDDFLLIESGFEKPAMMGARTTTIVRNIDAHSYGLEAELAWAFAEDWKADMTVAHVRGKNDSDDVYLAQLPPLEARLGINYNNGTWSYGALWRGVAAQNKVAVNQGNIVGQDIGKTAGFGILSFNGGWQATEELLLTAGIDNVLDKTYAEHLSRAGTDVSGFDQTTRVNEPGLMAWLKAQVSF